MCVRDRLSPANLLPEDLLGVALRPSSLTSCVVTRGVRVESPIMLFHGANRGKVIGEVRAVSY